MNLMEWANQKEGNGFFFFFVQSGIIRRIIHTHPSPILFILPISFSCVVRNVQRSLCRHDAKIKYKSLGWKNKKKTTTTTIKKKTGQLRHFPHLDLDQVLNVQLLWLSNVTLIALQTETMCAIQSGNRAPNFEQTRRAFDCDVTVRDCDTLEKALAYTYMNKKRDL